MIIFGLGTSTGAYVCPVKKQESEPFILSALASKNEVSNYYTFERIETLENCYPETY